MHKLVLNRLPLHSYYDVSLPHDVLHLVRQHDPAVVVARLPRPARGEGRGVEAREGVGLCVEDDLVEGENVVWREEEIEVL